MPIVYALSALISSVLAYGTSVRFQLPLWLAAHMTFAGANLGVAVVTVIIAVRSREGS